MSLSITGLGLISSVGRDLASTAAAVRAGLAEAREISYFPVVDEETQEPTPLVGHPVHGYTEGFVSLGRWLRLVEGCLDDLRQDPEIPDPRDARFWQSTCLVFVAPRLDPDRLFEVAENVDEIKEAFLAQIVDLLEAPIRDAERLFVDRGPAGVAAALDLAQERIARGTVERALVIAADSYLDMESLDWLHDRDRLKTKAKPAGLMPGEAGAAMLVEPPASARRRRAATRAIVEAHAFDHEPNHYVAQLDGSANGVNTGAALARVIRAAVASLPGGMFEGDLHLDLSGEVWRAHEWGHAQNRLAGVFGPRVRTLLPCGSLGDVGAASAIAAIGCAARSFARGYASGPRALVTASSEHGDVGAIVVRAEA
jgi:3-oxoacyl-[acyl-carrier-protein] synthase-1